MITIDKDFEVTHLLGPLGNDADPGIAQQLRAHLSHCRPCCEAEAEVMALLERFRRAPAPPLHPELEQRLLDACLDCDSPFANTGDGPAIITI